MVTKKTEATEALKQLTYLAAALKAPRITEAAGRLAVHPASRAWSASRPAASVIRGAFNAAAK